MTKAVDPVRRLLLKGSILAGAVATSPALAAQSADKSARSPAPSPRLKVAEAGVVETGQQSTPSADTRETIMDPGSDFMIDVLRKAGIRHVALTPGSTFRGLQESLINYAQDRDPAMLVCVHEEISAAAAHGYAKVSGEMMACVVHSTVGLQHASMAIYDAWCDRVPMLVIVANILDATQRRPGVEWTHTMEDVATIVRDYIKWDDTPVSLQHFAESVIRACQYARTGPQAPVLIVADAELQERDIKDRKALSIPARVDVALPAPEQNALDRLAAMLVSAEAPVIVADRAIRSKEGMAQLVQLAELINAPVLDQGGRMNMPNTHFLHRPPHEARVVGKCDVLLGLELSDPWGTVYSYADLTERTAVRRLKASAKVALIGMASLFAKPNVQDNQRYFAADMTIAADAETSLQPLIAAIQRHLTPERRAVIAARAGPLQAAHAEMRHGAVQAAALGWDSSPISSARLAAELWSVIEQEPWGLVNDPMVISGWPLRLWDFTEPHHHIGGSGGYGVGYHIGSSLGAALGHKEAGRFAVSIQGDGDLMMLPGTLWSMAHHALPILIIVNNNRAWHQEVMHIQRMANRRNRGADRFSIGTTPTDPPIDHAGLARAQGVWAEGPITDPAKLGGALRRAMGVVKSGKPALLDVVMEPR